MTQKLGFEISGMVSVTASDLQTMQTAMSNQLLQHTQQITVMMQQQSSSIVAASCTSSPIATRSVARDNPYHWGGRYHPVPEGYEFATVSCKTLWDLWLHGSSSAEAPLGPFRYIEPQNDLIGNRNRVRFSRAKKVMDRLFQNCANGTNWKEIEDMDDRTADQTFEDALLTLLNVQAVDRNTARLFELSYFTIYNMFSK